MPSATSSPVDFSDLSPQGDDYASRAVERLLWSAIKHSASDIHISQRGETVDVRWRVHGRLHELGRLPLGKNTSMIARIKALAGLITYRRDIPQEGRMVIDKPTRTTAEMQRADIADTHPPGAVEARVACLPTLHGEQVVVRLALSTIHEWQLAQLGLTEDSLQRLRDALGLSSGVVLISGPAGSGKTTSAYAALRELLADVEPRSIVSLEDPVECEIAGVAQSQINPSAGYDWSTGLKAVLRQDAEAMFIGEIRDAETASIAFQAAMTGQLVLTTMHARSSVDCLQRLLDMGVPYQHLRGGLNLLSCQRLIPRRCNCQLQASPQDSRCERCAGSGSDGLLLLSENLPALDGELARSLTVEADVLTLQAAALSQGMISLAESAAQAVDEQRILESDIVRYI